MGKIANYLAIDAARLEDLVVENEIVLFMLFVLLQ